MTRRPLDGRVRYGWRPALLLVLSTFSLFHCARPERIDTVVLIVVDTLRADHLGLYGHDRPTTPELDQWARKGVVFERAFAPSPWTLPSFGSIFTGRLPSEHRAGSFGRRRGDKTPRRRRFLKLHNTVPTLAEDLAHAGWRTGAFVNNTFLHSRFGLDRGFQSYDYREANNRKLRRADEVVEDALKWLDKVPEKEQRTFLTVHLFDPHLNYDPPPPFKGRFGGPPSETGASDFPDLKALRARIRDNKEIAWPELRMLYDEEIAFVDEQIGRLLAGIAERGLWERALVLFTADHGEEFFDHGGFEHGHSFYNEVLRVPLVLWGPGIEPGRSTRLVSLIDLYPTVLQALRLEAPDDLTGRSFWPATTDSDVETGEPLLISERNLYGRPQRALIRWPYKLVEHLRTGRTELYDLGSDPEELSDLSNSRPALTAELSDLLEQALVTAAELPDDTEAELDETALENLRSLGYIE